MQRHGIVWCPHCSNPHRLGTAVCPEKGLPLERSMHWIRGDAKPGESALQPQEQALIGTVLAGKYRVLRLIGRGGMSHVFEAEYLPLRRRVAIKVVANVRSEQALARLRSEARLVSAIHHPNICAIYDVGALGDGAGAPYLVLERLFGETLGSRIEREVRLSNSMVVSIFTQILAALDAAHEASIIHRDLKPENVFLATARGCPPHVKLLDFGCAKDLTAGRGNEITRPGQSVGTPQYMAPEQLMGDPADRRTDLFAVGLMLFEALTSVHPFAAPTKAALQRNVLRGLFTSSLTTLRPDLGIAIETLLLRALAPSPADRFRSAATFQRALHRAFHDLVGADLDEDDDDDDDDTKTIALDLPRIDDASPSSGAF
jgi:eukaryotic-like serine/threonine-protein kinase